MGDQKLFGPYKWKFVQLGILDFIIPSRLPLAFSFLDDNRKKFRNWGHHSIAHGGNRKDICPYDKFYDKPRETRLFLYSQESFFFPSQDLGMVAENRMK